jgi:hypothetical protein
MVVIGPKPRSWVCPVYNLSPMNHKRPDYARVRFGKYTMFFPIDCSGPKYFMRQVFGRRTVCEAVFVNIVRTYPPFGKRTDGRLYKVLARVARVFIATRLAACTCGGAHASHTHIPIAVRFDGVRMRAIIWSWYGEDTIRARVGRACRIAVRCEVTLRVWRTRALFRLHAM